MQDSRQWLEARVVATRDLTPTVREISLQPAAASVPAHQSGAHLQLQVLVAGRPQTRSYSLVGEPDGQAWRIAVKRLEQGRGGSLAMWRLAVGDRLPVTAPQNHFALDLDAGAYLLVAGGIGVTPLLLMAQTLARRGLPLRMLYAARSAAELAYLPQLRSALGERLQCVVSEAGAHIDFEAEIAALAQGGQMYVCGPAPMLEAARRAWGHAHRPRAALRYETFGSSGRLAPQAFRVQIARHALDFTVPADCSLLDALDAAGVQTISDCKRGECGLCAMDVLALEGEIDHRDVFLSEREKQDNRRICTCVSRVVGSITLDSAYRPD